jgi:competence protein ComEA
MPESTFAQSSVTNQARAAGTARSVPVNVNTADYPELLRLPGIGPVLAGRIMAHRDHYGPFAAVDSLIRISGIGPAKLAKLRPLLCVQ